MGHRDLLVTQIYLSLQATNAPGASREAFAARAASSKSRCGKRLKSFALTHCWGTSALDDGFEAVGFEFVPRIRGGLRVGVGADLNAKMLVRAGGDDEGGKFLWSVDGTSSSAISSAMDILEFGGNFFSVGQYDNSLGAYAVRGR